MPPVVTPIDVSTAAIRQLREALDLAARGDFNLLIGGALAVHWESLARLVHHRGSARSAIRWARLSTSEHHDCPAAGSL
jgi:hypothetical protein